MAKMWPQVLPQWIVNQPQRSAEVKVFKKLNDELDDSWSVFYSRPWWGVNPRGGDKDGEADFIIAHPELGLLFLEVKGGRIAYDPAHEKWTSVNRHDVVFRIKDPVKQAMECKHQVIRQLSKLQKWPGYMSATHGVVFTDSMGPEGEESHIGPYDRGLFCHAMEFDADLGGWIFRRLRSIAQPVTTTAGADMLECVYDLLAKPVELLVPLRRKLEDLEYDMDSLATGAQLHVQSLIQEKQRLLIMGGAGTGKTVVAVEAAARFADKGKSVVILCTSSALVESLSRQVRDFNLVEVHTVRNWENITHRKVPDVVIVDEAQDIDIRWWEIFDTAPYSEVRLFAFLDSNQSIYGRPMDMEAILNCDGFNLRVNLRNTKEIAMLTEGLYEGPLIDAIGPHGTKPQFVPCAADQARFVTEDRVIGLVQRSSVRPESIAVLAGTDDEVSQIRSDLEARSISSTSGSEPRVGSVTVEKISTFKGLEATCIFIVASRDVSQSRKSAYIAVSRARSMLVVVGEIGGVFKEARLASSEKGDS